MSRFRRLFPDAEEHPQNPFLLNGLGENLDLHSSYLLSFKQTIPQAISRNDTRNISTPTGKMAAMRMPSPSPSAQMPRNLRLPSPCLL